MGNRGTRAARRVPVDAGEPLIGGGYDYADAFEMRLSQTDPRSAEEFVRAALERAPWPVRETIWNTHRHLLRLRLGPRSSPDHMLGWRIATSEPDVIRLEAESPLLGRAVLVGRRIDPTAVMFTTYLYFARPAAARALWTVVGPLHRRIAPYLLERAAPAEALHSSGPPRRLRTPIEVHR